MKITDQVRSKFVKDNNLPIPLISEPYFSYFIDLYDTVFNTKSKLEKFLSALEEVGSDQSFFSKSKEFSNEVVNKISENQAYKDYTSGDMSKYQIKKPVSSKNVYCSDNLNRFLISIDMSSANFNALKFHNPEIVLGCESYKELVSKFTEIKPFTESKQIRQVIFGHLNPKRQQTIQKYMMSLVVDLLDVNGFERSRFLTASSDEVVLLSTKDKIEDEMKSISTIINEKLLKGVFTVEGFMLNCVRSTKTEKVFGYVKEFVGSEKVEFKTVPAYMFAQVYKKYFNLKIEEIDRKFTFEGMIATFDISIE
eukprot:gene6477-10482_t